MSIYGPLTSNWHVERALIAHLKTWQETYLAEIERQNEIDARKLPVFRSWEAVDQIEKWPESRLPACVIVARGITDRPRREGDGRYRATYRVEAIAVAGTTHPGEDGQSRSDMLANLYAAAILGAVMQHQSLSGFAEGVTWLQTAARPLALDDERRTLAASGHLFGIDVHDVLDARGGPAEPPDDPYAVPADWPTVEATEITVEKPNEEDS